MQISKRPHGHRCLWRNTNIECLLNVAQEIEIIVLDEFE